VNRHGIAATVKSISWLSAENFATTLVAAVVSIIVARTLGAAAVGTWGYVFAIYSVSLLLTTLGLDQMMIVDLVAAREQRGTIIATALALRMTVSIVLAATLISASFATNAQTP